MKKRDALLLAGAVLGLTVAGLRGATWERLPGAPAADTGPIREVPPGYTVVVFPAEVEGCPACATAVQWRLEAIEGVRQVEVDPELDQIVVVALEDLEKAELVQGMGKTRCPEHGTSAGETFER